MTTSTDSGTTNLVAGLGLDWASGLVVPLVRGLAAGLAVVVVVVVAGAELREIALKRPKRFRHQNEKSEAFFEITSNGKKQRTKF